MSNYITLRKASCSDPDAVANVYVKAIHVMNDYSPIPLYRYLKPSLMI
jgi:hypothetical protein